MESLLTSMISTPSKVKTFPSDGYMPEENASAGVIYKALEQYVLTIWVIIVKYKDSGIGWLSFSTRV